VQREGEGEYVTYKRDSETLARKLAIPGTPGYEHQIGGLEKNETVSVSYDCENHEEMTRLREAKVQGIAKNLPPIQINGEDRGSVIVLGWGSSYGAITTAVNQLQEEGEKVSNVHLRYLNPLPRRLDELLRRFETVLIPELNSGQLSFIIRGKYLVDAKSFTKMQGRPFGVTEIYEKIKELL
jgi:2-oxoglutarate ferredoxin oxidoreductase subunit alpha